MKLKKLWIPTLILGIIGGAAKLCDTLLNTGYSSFFLDSTACSTIFVFSLLVILLIGFGMLISDRKVGIEAVPTKNTGAAVFGFIASVAVVGSGVISLLSMGSSESVFGNFIGCVLGLLGGIVLLYESCISFTGQNGMKKFPILTLALPVWACARLVVLFIEYSKVSLHATEMYDIISVTLLTLFLFYQAMYFAELNPKNSVRRMTLYGCSYIMCGLIVTADIIIKMFMPTDTSSNIDTFIVEPTLSRILTCTADIAFCGYALFFIAGMLKDADITENEEEYEDENAEFLGSISTAENGEEVTIKKNDELPEPEPFSGSILRFEDTMTLSTTELKKAAESISAAEPVTVPDPVVEPEPIIEEPEPIVEPEPIIEEPEPIVEPEPIIEEPEPVVEPKPIIEEPEPIVEPKPIIEEPEPIVEPEPIIEEPEPVVEPEPITEEPEPVVEPETAYEPEPVKTEIKDTEEEFENVFADDNGDVDYDEIFRLLDEMSESSNTEE